MGNTPELTPAKLAAGVTSLRRSRDRGEDDGKALANAVRAMERRPAIQQLSLRELLEHMGRSKGMLVYPMGNPECEGFAAIHEAIAAGFVRGDSGSWSHEDRFKLTNEGRRFIGLPPVPSMLDRFFAWLGR